MDGLLSTGPTPLSSCQLAKKTLKKYAIFLAYHKMQFGQAWAAQKSETEMLYYCFRKKTNLGIDSFSATENFKTLHKITPKKRVIFSPLDREFILFPLKFLLQCWPSISVSYYGLVVIGGTGHIEIVFVALQITHKPP